MGCFLLLVFHSIGLSRKGEVLIGNSATEPAKNGEREVYDPKIQFGGIDQGKSKLVLWKGKADSHDKLVAEFHSGRKLTRDLGYVMRRRDFMDTLTLKDHEASLTRLPEKDLRRWAVEEVCLFRRNGRS